MDQRHAKTLQEAEDGLEPRELLSLPFLTNEERDFWRRAVAAERQRQLCGRHAPHRK